jgi:hypothetical protein
MVKQLAQIAAIGQDTRGAENRLDDLDERRHCRLRMCRGDYCGVDVQVENGRIVDIKDSNDVAYVQ